MNIEAKMEEQQAISNRITANLKLYRILDDEMKALACKHESIQMEIDREIGEGELI